MQDSLAPDLTKVALSLYAHLDSAVSLSCYILLKHGEYPQLATKRVDPSHYSEGPWGCNAFARDTQAVEFLRKSPLLPLGLDLVAKAIETFDECEASCASTNEVLRVLEWRRNNGSALSPLETATSAILAKARSLAARILGPLPDDLNGRFGPGTAFELKGATYTTVADKVCITPHVTPSCAPVFTFMLNGTAWDRYQVGIGSSRIASVKGNRFTTVPKSATARRGICIEPLGNLWCQLAIGSYLKGRLAKVGLHVGCSPTASDPPHVWRTDRPYLGQQAHRLMARAGSLDGSFATIDLSNASDTVSFELVRQVLPADWFSLLAACRSSHTLLSRDSDSEPVWVRLEKFSSMGNGFTFELETLLFAVLLAAATGLKVGSDLFVYGDDILLPGEYDADARAVLEMFGFTPNTRKSYATGPFRESCGGDYFSGYSVRAVYADAEFTEPTDWICIHNQLRARWGQGPYLKRIVDQIPVRLRRYGPGFLSDQVLHGPYKARTRNGIDYVAVIRPITRRVNLERWSESCHLAVILYGGARSGRRGVKPYLSVRGSPVGYRIRIASVS